MYFRFKAETFQVFGQIFSSTVLRTALVSRFFNHIYANLFRTSRKMFLPGLSELHSTCTKECFCFHRKHLLWKKNSFQIIFRILDGDYPGFRRKISNTVVRIALDTRLLIGFMSNKFELCATFVSWSIRSTLHVSTGLCLQEASSLKKTLFQMYFRF